MKKNTTVMRLFSTLMVGVLTFSLTACSSDKTNTANKSESKTEAGSDLDYIKQKGSLIIGITDFAPMDYKDDDGNWIGFDADLAKKVCEDLGVKAEFIEIDWDNKILELDNKSIDVVWNGMTLTDEVKSSMNCTKSYLQNAQVVVLPKDKADKYKDVNSLKDLSHLLLENIRLQLSFQMHLDMVVPLNYLQNLKKIQKENLKSNQ